MPKTSDQPANTTLTEEGWIMKIAIHTSRVAHLSCALALTLSGTAGFAAEPEVEQTDSLDEVLIVAVRANRISKGATHTVNYQSQGLSHRL